jgi:hypothetical protein
MFYTFSINSNDSNDTYFDRIFWQESIWLRRWGLVGGYAENANFTCAFTIFISVHPLTNAGFKFAVIKYEVALGKPGGISFYIALYLVIF